MHQYTTQDIREEFKKLLSDRKFTSVNRESSMTDLVGGTTIEIINASFIADEDSIFGKVNQEYIQREEQWYNSQSLNVNGIPGGAPAIWKAVADKDGYINSNYGWCIYSPANGFHYYHNAQDVHNGSFELDCQYVRARDELKNNSESRRAIMIYTRPSMWQDYNKGGRSDFMCTNTVQYVIRNGALHSIVQMRSNDSIFGFRNDRAWQQHVLESLGNDLGIPTGHLYWNVGSLHVYARHYYLVDHFAQTGELHITQKEYASLYPNSPYLLG